MILHDGSSVCRIVPAREIPLFPRSLDQMYEAKKLDAEAPDQTNDFFQWWNKQCDRREIPRCARSPENVAIVRRLLYKHGYQVLTGAALMVLNNLQEPLANYQHPMRYLAAKMPEALDLLARWERDE